MNKVDSSTLSAVFRDEHTDATNQVAMLEFRIAELQEQLRSVKFPSWREQVGEPILRDIQEHYPELLAHYHGTGCTLFNGNKLVGELRDRSSGLEWRVGYGNEWASVNSIEWLINELEGLLC